MELGTSRRRRRRRRRRMFLFDHTMQYKNIYREQYGQETPIKMQLASLSWEPPTEQTKYIMPTKDIEDILDNAIIILC